MSLEKIVGGGVIVEAEGPLGTARRWSTVASLSVGRYRLAAAEAGGLVYAIGGFGSGGNQLSTVEEYDPDTDTWSTVASLPTEREDTSAAEANGFVYAIGGADSNFNTLSSVEKYDPDTDTWSTVASLSTTRQDLAAAEANGFVYAIGGKDPNGNELTLVEKLIFDPIPEDVYTATGDTLVGIDDPNGTLLNRATGREQTGDSLIAQSGETIAAFVQSQARIYRTEET
jgi:hypothetical protein